MQQKGVADNYLRASKPKPPLREVQASPPPVPLLLLLITILARSPPPFSSSFQSSSPMDELKKISASEVPLHTSKDDCWLVIEGKVYDVTKFLKDHPGGEEVLVHASGRGDATQAFVTVGHSSTARKRMAKYVIGVLEGYDPSKAPEATKSSKSKGGHGSKAAQGKSPVSLPDLLYALICPAVAVVLWFMLNDQNTA